jgi:hypothetical protein
MGARRKKTVPMRIPGSKCKTTDVGRECDATSSVSDVFSSVAVFGVTVIGTPFKDL